MRDERRGTFNTREEGLEMRMYGMVRGWEEEGGGGGRGGGREEKYKLVLLGYSRLLYIHIIRQHCWFSPR